MNNIRNLWAETFGTFWLVFGGCGTAVLAGSGVGTLGISIAFGLTVLTMAYAVGHVSGGHFNPAVTVGLWAGGRFPAKDIAPYVMAQVVGAILAAFVIYWIASGNADWSLAKDGLAANTYSKYTMAAAFMTEVVLTAFFLIVIMGSTHKLAPAGAAPIAIGLALTLIHLISIPITNTSVNPARSTGPALLVGGDALSQLPLFWIAPLIGGALGGWLYRTLICED
ncbi:MAG: Aquaporin [Pseudomonadota bacterium]|jgi:aquaporin Z